MTSTLQSKPKATIAVLGASGDVAGWALATALINGHKCRALARDPVKVTDLMAAKGVTPDALQNNLVIVKGNAKDKDDVKRLVQDESGKTVDIILTSVGGSPLFEWSWNLITMADPHVCESSMHTLLAVLAELAQDSKATTQPHVIAVSTTGLGLEDKRDAPALVLPLYHWLLKVPHDDKAKMETKLRSATAGIGRASVVRGTAYVGEAQGHNVVRAGTIANPPIGYTVARKDVGEWIYHNLFSGQETKWNGETIVVTN